MKREKNEEEEEEEEEEECLCHGWLHSMAPVVGWSGIYPTPLQPMRICD